MKESASRRRKISWRRLLFEQLERRHMLAAAWRNPVDALDVSGDQFIVPLDALVVINDLNANGARELPLPRVDLVPPFLDVNGNNSVEPNDVLRVINALNAGIDGTYELREGPSLATESSVLIGLGQEAGSRIYQLAITADFDPTDPDSTLGDRLLIYLVDPQNPDRTLLDRGEPGTALFALHEDGAEFTPGLVTFNGSQVSIDLTSLKDQEEGLLLFQLLGGDSDAGSTITIRPLSNITDRSATARPVFPEATFFAEIGPVIDVSSLTDTDEVVVLLENVRYDSKTGRLTAEMRIRNDGPSVGRDVIVAFAGLPQNVELVNASGVDGNGTPYLNLRSSLPSGGLPTFAVSQPVQVVFDHSGDEPLSLVAEVRVGGPNRPPVIAPVGPLSAMPGGRLEVSISASDPDGDPIKFSLQSDRALPSGVLDGKARLVFSPTLADVGTYQFTLMAHDGAANFSQQVVLQVVADATSSTRLSGVVRDESGDALPGVQVELDTLVATTDTNGAFTIDLGTMGPLPAQTLSIRGDMLAGPRFYPLLRANTGQLLGREPLEDVNNVIAHPLTLIPLDTANATAIDPAQNLQVTTPAVPGAALLIRAGTLRDAGGGLFAGELTVTEITRVQVAALIPPQLAPDMIVNIGLGDINFTSPAPLTLPNRAGWGPNLEMDLFGINPVNGAVEDVGDGRVSGDGSLVETIAGGILAGGIAFFVPRGETPQLLTSLPFNADLETAATAAPRPFTSDVELHSGALIETHDLVTYSSLGESRGVTLVYDSLRADPQPIIHFGYSDVDASELAGDRADRLQMRAQLRFVNAAGFTVNEPDHFFAIPLGRGRIDAAIQTDLVSEPTGVYEYRIDLGLFLRDAGGALAGTALTQNGRLVHVNAVGSPFGHGWGLSGWQELFRQADGSVLLVDGDGSELLFSPPSASGMPHHSPPGDFSSLQEQPDGTFHRMLRDGTRVEFDEEGRLASTVDRNGNQTDYVYNAEGQLTAIVDPVNLATVFTYTGGLVTAITDPANRTTSLEYDTAGNLVRIIDPDQSAREFAYDNRHLLSREINKLQDQELTRYGFHGRAIEGIRADHSVVQLVPVATQGLFPATLTTNPEAPPFALRLPEAVASVRDGNGGVTAAVVNSQGQILTQSDGEGCYLFRQITLNSNFLPEFVEDCNGNEYHFLYDENGNVIALQDALSVTEGGLEYSLDPATPNDLAFGDFNSDTIPDLAVTVNGLADITILLGNGDGTLRQGEEINDGTNVDKVLAGDVNGDTNLDLIGIRENGSQSIYVWLGAGDGTFGAPQTLNAGTGQNVQAVKLGDFNSDQKPDLLAVTGAFNSAGDVALFFGLGGGDFDTPVQIECDRVLPRGAGVGDVNDDGKLDFVIGSQFGGNLALYLGAGDGTFTRSDIPSTATFINSLEIREIDGQPGDDVLIAHSNGITLFRSAGDGTFAPGSPVAAGVPLEALAVGDLDGDTILDLAAIDSTDIVVAVFLGTGNANFTRIQDTQLPPAFIPDLEVVDLDGDNDLDFVAVSVNTSEVAVRLNNGNGLGRNQRPAWLEIEYDRSFNEPTALLDLLGRRRQMEIDPASGNLLSQSLIIGEPDGTSGENDDIVTYFTYTPAGLVETETDAAGHVTFHEYDAWGRLTRTTLSPGEAEEATREFEYDSAGNRIAVIDENGNRTETDYDALNRPTTTREADGSETAQGYDQGGRVVQTIDAHGNVTEFVYDEAGRVVRHIAPDPDGPGGPAVSPVTQFAYNTAGNRVLEIDPLGHETRYSYDFRGRVTEVVDAGGGRTRFEYETQPSIFNDVTTGLPLEFNDRPIVVVDAAGNRTEFEYDPRGRLIREVDPLGNSIQYEYDAADNLTRKVDRNGRETRFTYDALDRLVEELWLQPDGSLVNVVQYTFDPVGNLLDVRDSFSELHFSFDTRGQLTSASNVGTPGAPPVTLNYSYDGAGNVVTVTETIAGQPGGVLTYSYDSLNRMERLTQSGTGVTPKRVDFDYFEGDQFAEVKRFADLAGTQLITASSYEYDNLSRLVRLNHTSGTGTTLAFYELSWDSAGRITQIADVDGTRDFNYDNTNQLLAAISNGTPPDEFFSYDANGNRTGPGVIVGPANRLTSDGLFDLEYDAEGNVIRRTDLSTGSVREFAYDHRQRLTQTLDKDAGGNEILRVEFVYDSLNHRISKRVTSPGSDFATYFVYDVRDLRTQTITTDAVLLDFVDDDGPTGLNPPVLAVRYLHGPGVDQVFAQEEVIGDEVYWLLPDHQGSTRDIATHDPTTQETTVVNHIIYDAFGSIVFQSNPAVTTRYLFTGREFDAELNLHYYRARYYDATTGRFLSEDPLRFGGGDLNLFRYVRNEPHQFRDPTGRILSHVTLLIGIDRDSNDCERKREEINALEAEFEKLTNEYESNGREFDEDYDEQRRHLGSEITELQNFINVNCRCGAGSELAVVAVVLLAAWRWRRKRPKSPELDESPDESSCGAELPEDES